MPYPAIYSLTQEATVKGHYGDVRSMFLREMTDEALDAILRNSHAMVSPFGIAQLRVLGGEMARVPDATSSFTHRDKPFMFSAINVWMDPRESERQRAWTERFWQDMRPHAAGVYVNFLGDEGEDRILEAYGPATYERLATLKARYDPTNFFRLNQNIKPATQQEEQAA
ncbi:MAG: BBE domain-containing protein [Chloroflexota bacterium]